MCMEGRGIGAGMGGGGVATSTTYPLCLTPVSAERWCELSSGTTLVVVFPDVLLLSVPLHIARCTAYGERCQGKSKGVKERVKVSRKE